MVHDRENHYNDVIISAMAFQITSLTIVYSSFYLGADQEKTSKPRVIGLCAGNSSVTGEFPAQRTRNAENISIWWRHHETGMTEISLLTPTPALLEYHRTTVSPFLSMFLARGYNAYWTWCNWNWEYIRKFRNNLAEYVCAYDLCLPINIYKFIVQRISIFILQDPALDHTSWQQTFSLNIRYLIQCKYIHW